MESSAKLRHRKPDVSPADSHGSEDIPTSRTKPQRTYGRIPDGTTFVVPRTSDMVSQLFDPRQPKNASDIVVLITLVVHALVLYGLPAWWRQPVFAVVFLFWRGAYNVGIGYLLKIQSRHGRLVAWARRAQLFTKSTSDDAPRPWLQDLLRRELEAKVKGEYRMETAPVEYNTWLLFRKVVDLILMCDFWTYGLFALACYSRPAEESGLVTIARSLAGLALVALNVFIKVDAHRVVGDYAWYWGDFFFLIDADLTFDSVFLLAPHPMYSIGYIGYYGVSILTASYRVLLISVIAHAAQFAFLMLVENPHIENVYNAPKRRSELKDGPAEDLHQHQTGDGEAPIERRHPNTADKLMGFKNFSLFRVTDLAVILVSMQGFFLTLLTPTTRFYQAAFVLNAIFWRLIFTVGLGVILRRQSKSRRWTAHYLKHGQTVHDAWAQWKSVYHVCMVMCHGSFIAAAWKMYAVPSDWSRDFALFRHVLGAFLVALQVWTVASIYDSLGEFGFYMGDFFYDPPKLTYDGIYRFLNNPERVLGLTGFYGVALITGSKSIFTLALLSHVVSLGFIHWVEAPHMRRHYGKSIRQEAGITIGLKTAVPRQIHGSVEKVIQETSHIIEDFFDNALPGVTSIVADLFKHNKTPNTAPQSPARITITRTDYTLQVKPSGPRLTKPPSAETMRRSPVEGSAKLWTDDFRPLTFDYGTPISISWTAPRKHSKKDWIGLYMVADNKSREVTRVSSAGRWTWIVPDEFEASRSIITSEEPVSDAPEAEQLVQGEVIFEGDKLFWESGTYEFRLHHDGKHNVMALSLPFEIRLERSDVDDAEDIEEILLPVIRHAFDRDPDIAPKDVVESFGPRVEREGKYAKRVTYAIHQLFGIEFAPAVVLADGNVKNLAWRISNAKKVLAPYSMSSRGTTTPVRDTF